MRPLALALALALVPALAPFAAAQDHAHTGEARPVILFDLRPDGHAVVGEVTHLGYVLLNEHGFPQVHQDAHVKLAQEGVALFDSASPHEYDGLYGLDVVFDRPGPFEFTVEWQDRVATYRGNASEPSAVVEGAGLDLVAPTEAVAGEAVAFDLGIVDASGALVPHSDVIVEVRRGLTLVMRTHLHTHEDRIAFEYAFPETGTYDLTFTSYIAFPSPGEADLRAFATTHTVAVSPSPPVPTPLASALGDCAADPVFAVPAPTRAAAAGEAPTVNVSVDPQAVVGPDTVVRLNALVLNGTGEARAALQHVNLEAAVTGPQGVVFRSSSLHEYDGHFELAIMPGLFGAYQFEASASRGGDLGAAAQGLCVVPPVAPLGAAARDVTVAGLEGVVAGVPATLDIAFLDAAGRPVDHSEVDVSVVGSAGLTVLNTKLHGHAGRFLADVAFPDAGGYTVLVSPEPLLQSLSLAEGVAVDVDVAAAPVLGAAVDRSGATASVPGLGAVAVLAAFAVAILRRR